jgi:uncharacterized glyoxalase superfamily protein PhnB
MPSSVVIPVLAYADVGKAVEWLCRTFGFVERLRIGNHRAQLSFGDGSIVVARKQGDRRGAGLAHSVMVRLADIDSHFQRAKKCGARIVHPPADYPYGERQYTVEDIGGHIWTFSQTVADVDPETWGGTLFE